MYFCSAKRMVAHSKMNRLTYLIKAKTVYSVQSPLVYDLCTRVLWTPLSAVQCRRIGTSRQDDFAQLCYKTANFLQPPHMAIPVADDYHRNAIAIGYPRTAVSAIADTDLQGLPSGSVILLSKPHISSANEELWHSLCSLPNRTAAIDIFSAGMVIIGRGMSRQDFLLR